MRKPLCDNDAATVTNDEGPVVVFVDDLAVLQNGIAPAYLVSAGTPEELAQQAFSLLVARLGDKRARQLWGLVPKRRRGRPSRSEKESDSWLLPGILKFERQMPGASTTGVVTAFVQDAAARGYHFGASQEATIRRLERFRKRMLAQGVAIRQPRSNNRTF